MVAVVAVAHVLNVALAFAQIQGRPWPLTSGMLWSGAR